MKKYALAALAALATLSGVATAAGTADQDHRNYFGVMANYIDADQDERFVENSLGGKLLLGRHLTPGLALELGFSYNEFDARAPGTLEQDDYTLGLDALVFPLKQAFRLQPFAKFGVGVTVTEDTAGGVPSNLNTTDPSASVGVGLLANVDRYGLAFRADISHRWLWWDSLRDNGSDPVPEEWITGLGVIYPFGGPVTKAAAAAPAPVAAPQDSDRDGVIDSKDRCPGTPLGTAVDADGCPLGGELDSDGDGVPDSADRCPNTPAGTSVDVNGCPLPETVVIYFAFDSAKINAPGQAALDRVAASLNNRNFVVSIANGHADSTGTAEYNLGLSQRRADSVAKYLASKGVGAEQIRTRAYGETRPAADDSTEVGRAKNRRVEINLLRQ